MYSPHVLQYDKRDGTVGPQGGHQSHLGDLLDMLVFDRPLRLDELLAVQDYLRANGSIQK